MEFVLSTNWSSLLRSGNQPITSPVKNIRKIWSHTDERVRCLNGSGSSKRSIPLRS